MAYNHLPGSSSLAFPLLLKALGENGDVCTLYAVREVLTGLDAQEDVLTGLNGREEAVVAIFNDSMSTWTPGISSSPADSSG